MNQESLNCFLTYMLIRFFMTVFSIRIRMGGNVIAMPDVRLGLIDYGAACLISRTQRKAFAELFIAIDQAS